MNALDRTPPPTPRTLCFDSPPQTPSSISKTASKIARTLQFDSPGFDSPGTVRTLCFDVPDFVETPDTMELSSDSSPRSVPPEDFDEFEKEQSVLRSCIMPNPKDFSNAWFGMKPNPNEKQVPDTPRMPLKRKSIFVTKETQQRQAHFEKARTVWNKILGLPHRFPVIGTGRFRTVVAYGKKGVLKFPNKNERDESEGNGIAFERIRESQKNHKALLKARKEGHLPKYFAIPKTRFLKNALIWQTRCLYPFTRNDLKRPGVLPKIAHLFQLAFNETMPNIDLRLPNLGWMDRKKTKLGIFDDLEGDFGSFPVRTKTLLEEWAEGNEKIYRALDPRPPGSYC